MYISFKEKPNFLRGSEFPGKPLLLEQSEDEDEFPGEIVERRKESRDELLQMLVLESGQSNAHFHALQHRIPFTKTAENLAFLREILWRLKCVEK